MVVGKKEVFMVEKLKLIWKRLKIILRDKSGEGDMEAVKNILFTPLGYKFLKNNIEKYSV